MRIRKLKIFAVVFMALVLLAAYCLASLRTYTFKPPSPSADRGPIVVARAACEAETVGGAGDLGERRPYGAAVASRKGAPPGRRVLFRSAAL